MKRLKTSGLKYVTLPQKTEGLSLDVQHTFARPGHKFDYCTPQRTNQKIKLQAYVTSSKQTSRLGDPITSIGLPTFLETAANTATCFSYRYSPLAIAALLIISLELTRFFVVMSHPCDGVCYSQPACIAC